MGCFHGKGQPNPTPFSLLVLLSRLGSHGRGPVPDKDEGSILSLCERYHGSANHFSSTFLFPSQKLPPKTLAFWSNFFILQKIKIVTRYPDGPRRLFFLCKWPWYKFDKLIRMLFILDNRFQNEMDSTNSISSKDFYSRSS